MYFLVPFGNWKLMFYDEKLFKIILHLCIYFVQKIAQLVLERLPLLGNSWSYKGSSWPTPCWIVFLMFCRRPLKCVEKEIFLHAHLDEIPLLFMPMLLILNLYLDQAIFGSISTILIPQLLGILREYSNRALAWKTLKYPIHDLWCSICFYKQNYLILFTCRKCIFFEIFLPAF